ncbi:MAG: hypothetical protein ABW101_16345 [Candidatus Thiodiazotropha sp.]
MKTDSNHSDQPQSWCPGVAWLRCACALLLVSFSSSLFAGQPGVPAFPGAEGFGAVSVGGRQGRVIKVTNLNSSGPGSLQAAVSTEGPRIVVFDVAGVIRGDLEVPHSYLTIAGESAPSPGITLVGRIVARPVGGERLHDLVIRFLRIRQKPVLGHTGDVIQLPKSERFILDHLSLSWGNDELLDIIHSSEVTVQWCTLEESDPEGHDKGVGHNFALLSAYPDSGNISIHHNLFAHNARRNPSLTPYEPGKPADFRNNVVYNFKEGLGHDGHKPVEGINLVGNYYKRGPDAPWVDLYRFSPKGRYHLEGNWLEGVGLVNGAGDLSFLDSFRVRVNRLGELVNQPFAVAPVETDDALTAYLRVLSQAGAFPRDRVTRRTVREVISSTGIWRRNAPAAPSDAWFLSGLESASPEPDRDGDGLPDAWEVSRGYDPDRVDSNRLQPSGYTVIETYLHERARALLDRVTRHQSIELAIERPE